MMLKVAIILLLVGLGSCTEVQACGSDLQNLLDEYCRSDHTAPNTERRFTPVENNGLLENVFHRQTRVQRSAADAMSVVEACCRRPCTVETLVSYCDEENN